VAILPYLEEAILYKQFHRDEPWDSAHNRPLSDTVLSFLTTESSEGPTTTTWKMLEGMPGGIIFIDAGKGTAVPWAQPDNFKLDPADPLASLGEEPAEGYLVVYKDVRAVRLKGDALKAALAGQAPPDTTPVAEDPPLETEPEPQPEPEPDPADVTETPAPEPRVWKDASGKFSVEAVLGEIKGASVTLIRTDTGKPITLPINKLSKEDQEYLKNLKEAP
jgi:hypothetical protein